MQLKLKFALLLTAVSLPLFTWMYINKFKRQEPAVAKVSIVPLVKQADLPMDKYYFKNDSSTAISRPTGTKINIQPGTFKREDGLPISGPVELQVREFHSANDILRAGIPMEINRERFEFLKSAGMIELRAYSEGKKLEIKEGKDIAIDLAGFRKSEGYSLYYLNDDREWVTKDSFSPTQNVAKMTVLKSLPSLPEKPMLHDTSAPGGLVFNFAGNALYAPQLKVIADRQWRILEDYDNPDVAQAMRINWDDVQLIPIDKEKNLFQIVFNKYIRSGDCKDDVYKTMKIMATPIFTNTGSKDDHAFFEAQLKEYNLVVKKIQEERQRLAFQADLLNSFAIKKMGIYNIDRLFKKPDLLALPVTFDFEDDLIKKINKVSVFGIYEEENSVVQYEPKDWKTIGFSPGKRMKLLAILPDSQMAIVENDAIQLALSGDRKNLHFTTKKCDAMAYLQAEGQYLAVNESNRKRFY